MCDGRKLNPMGAEDHRRLAFREWDDASDSEREVRNALASTTKGSSLARVPQFASATVGPGMAASVAVAPALAASMVAAPALAASSTVAPDSERAGITSVAPVTSVANHLSAHSSAAAAGPLGVGALGNGRQE